MRTRLQAERWPFKESFWNDYDVIQRLGSGNFGSVWQIRHRTSGRYFALKQCSESEQLDIERQLLSILSNGKEGRCHPNIVCYYDHFALTRSLVPTRTGGPGGHETSYNVLMEFLPGQDLRTWYMDYWRLHRHAPTPNLVASLLRTALTGLAFAHSRNIIHRDLHPQNIRVRNPDGQAPECVLFDFGLSCSLDQALGQLYQCNYAYFVGNAPSFAPEYAADVLAGYQKRGRSPLDWQLIDIWALAESFYRVVTNQQLVDSVVDDEKSDYAEQSEPFKPAMMQAIIARKVPERFYAQDVRISKLLHSMLHKNPRDRPTAQEALVKLL